jgi:hypothetical protein
VNEAVKKGVGDVDELVVSDFAIDVFAVEFVRLAADGRDESDEGVRVRRRSTNFDIAGCCSFDLTFVAEAA